MAAETAAGRQPLSRGFTAPGPHALRPRRKRTTARKRDSLPITIASADMPAHLAHAQPPRWAKSVLRAAAVPSTRHPLRETSQSSSSASSSEDAEHASSASSAPSSSSAATVIPSLPSSATPTQLSLPTVEAVPRKSRRLRRGDVVRAALNVLATSHVPLNVLVEENVVQSLVQLINDQHIFVSASDKVSITAAVHSLCTTKELRDAFVAANGLNALCVLLTPIPAHYRSYDGISNMENLHIVENFEDSDASLQSMPERKKLSLLTTTPDTTATASTRTLPNSNDIASWTPDGHPGVGRSVWNTVIRTIAKLMVCSVTACARSIDTGALALLARAAQPSEPIDIRVRAAAGLAAIAAWSGPRRAVQIVETPHVIKAMSVLLTESDQRISNHLRSALMDGLVAMSFHRRARRILREQGCDGEITAAAKKATQSGDYDIAARGTVAAGQLTGRSLDEFGFLVEEQNVTHHMDDSDEDDKSTLKDSMTQGAGLKQIEQQLLSEPYMQVEELNALEEIVLEDADSLTSSPRDRQLVRDAARMYGVTRGDSAEISPFRLDRAGSPTSQHEQSSECATPAPATEADDVQKVLRTADTPVRASAGEENLEQSPRGAARPIPEPVAAAKVQSPSFENSAVRGSIGGADTEDPDEDEPLSAPGLDSSNEGGRIQPSTSLCSRVLSPLMAFSLNTRKAAQLESAKAGIRKSSSQLNRDMRNERIWRDVLDNHPEYLERGTGSTRRVKAYRELAVVPVPSSLRRKLWPILLDVRRLQASRPNLYADLCKRGETAQLSDDIEHTIDADVTRTMPLHSLFWSGGAQVGVKSLRTILRCYAFFKPEIGYCQGMSSVAAVFMMNARDEEQAFLMFVQFMERFQYKRVFAMGFPQMRQWLDELRPLVEHYMPDLSRRLSRENVMLELYADKWLITALSHNFPHRYLLRIWDLMFLGGSPKIILKACLGVLKSCEPRLMGMEFEGMMSLLQRDFANPETGVLDLKNPEPFLAMIRQFKFIPNLPSVSPAPTGVSTTTSAQEQPTAASPTPPPPRQGVRACFCFKRSQTLD